MVRWRTLHELAVVAALVEEGDEDLAKRYMDHDAIEQKNSAVDFDQNHEALGYAAIDARTRRYIDAKYDEVVERYGREFRGQYGWASGYLGKARPTFKDIQAAVGRSTMNSYYKLASQNVHAGTRAAFFRLTTMGRDNVVLAGRSNAGLLEPGQSTGYTLTQITGSLLGTPSTLDQIVELSTLIAIRDAIPVAFYRASRKLYKDEAEFQRSRAQGKRKPKSLRRKTVSKEQM